MELFNILLCISILVRILIARGSYSGLTLLFCIFEIVFQFFRVVLLTRVSYVIVTLK